ncbi:hypothetical protein D3C85_101140 [compost metagenome]
MTASILQRLAQSASTPRPVIHLSLEDSIIEASGEADGNIEKLSHIAAEVEGHSDEISIAAGVSDNLTDLVDKSIAACGADGFDEGDAELLRLSVESILVNANIYLPANAVVPSFESSNGNYSTEVAEKKDGIIRRILTWLHTAMKAIADAFVSFWENLTDSGKSVENYLDKVKEKVSSIKADAKADATDVNVGSAAAYLTDKHSRIEPPSRHVVQTVALFEDFAVEWRNGWKSLVEFPLPTNIAGVQADQIGKSVTEFAKKSLAVKAVKLDVTSNHYLELTPGTGDNPIMGTKIKIHQSAMVNNTKADLLSVAELKTGVTVCNDGLKVLDQLKREMSAFTAITDKVGKLSKSVVAHNEKTDVAVLRTALSVLNKSCSLAAQGWINSTPYFLKTIKASIRYIDVCAAEYN